jgi:hypothetical protein
MVTDKKSKGISTFIATLLLMVLAVSAGVVIYAYTMGYLGGFGGPQTMGAISIDTYNFPTNKTLEIFVRNIGKTTFQLQSVYLDGAKLDGPSEPYKEWTTLDPLDENAVGSFMITLGNGPVKTFGTATHVIKLVGFDNTQISFNAKR